MKAVIKKIVKQSLAACCLLPLAAKAQDIHFSQFYETSILRNPALTGVFNGDYRLSVLYRNQWSSISAPFQTAQAGAELKKQIGESQDFIGIGLLGYFDRTGSINLTTLSGSAAVSYNKMLNEDHSTFLSIGLMGGYIQRNFDASKVTLGNQYQGGSFDPSNPSGEVIANPKMTQMDFGAGINYTTNSGVENRTNYTIGVSGYHLTRPENAFYDNAALKKDFRWNVNAGVNWLLTEAWSAQLQGNFSMQGKYNETIVGGMLGRKNDEAAQERLLILYAGVFYRWADAVIPVLKVDYNDLTLGVSYDMNVSRLRAASNIRGGFEISLIKTGLMTDPQRGFSKTVCPVR